MRKVSLLTLVVLMLIAVFPIHAQDDDYEACTAEDFIEASAVIVEAYEGIEASMDVSDEPGASELAVATVLVDSYTLDYWEVFYEASAEGLCAEVDWFGYTAGLVMDEMLITAQLSTLAVHESDAGNDEIALALSDLAVSRAETLEVGIEGINTIIEGMASGEMTLNFDLAECTDEEIDATWEGLDEIFLAYEEIATFTEEAEGEDLSLGVISFATLSEGYWDIFMPEVPACYEAQNEAIYAGLIIDETLITLAGYRLAELEYEVGDEDVALVFEENADIRYDDLAEAFEVYEDE